MEVITQHDRFFAKLVNLIPSELYLHTDTLTGFNNASSSSKVVKKTTTTIVQSTVVATTDKEEESGSDDDEESGVEEPSDLEDDDEDEADMTIPAEDEPFNKYYKHRKLPLSVDERKVRSQENKKRKYAADENDEADDGQSVGSSSIRRFKAAPKAEEDDGSKMENLRKKLQEKIFALKEQRASKKIRTNAVTPTTGNKKQQKGNMNKGNKNQSATMTAHDDDVDNDSINSLKNDLASSASNHRTGHDDDNMSLLTYDSIYNNESEPSFEFSNIAKFSKEELLKPKESKSKKDGGKVQRLKRLLQEAERKRERLKSLSKSGDEVLAKKAKGEQWNDALESAAGGKPLLVSTNGDVSLTEMRIKKALKRREKKKEKSASDWADRLQKVDDDKKIKVLKREENIHNRKHQNDIVKEKKDVDATADNAKHGKDNKNGKSAVSIRKPGADNHKGKSHDNNGHGKKNNRAGFEGKKSGSFLN